MPVIGKRAVAALFFALLYAPLCIQASVDPASVRRVHVVQSNHFDAGFCDFNARVCNRYLTGEWGTAAPPLPRNQSVFYPGILLNAANISQQLRQTGTASYKYMAQSWLVSLMTDCPRDFPKAASNSTPLRCPSEEQVDEVSAAIQRGDITWHAYPTNPQVELMDASFFEAGLQFSQELADQFHVARPSVLSIRDVPGLTRAAIPSMVRNGVIGVSVGVNDNSPAPLLPSTRSCAVDGEHAVREPFLWRDVESGEEIIADFHPGGYGGITPLEPITHRPYYGRMNRDGVLCDCVGIEGLADVLCYAWRGDNYGPAPLNESMYNWREFQSVFPNAVVNASSLDTFFHLLESHKHKLQVVTSEIGDSWMYGVPSDPFKLAAFRQISRTRAECIRVGLCDETREPGFSEFSRLLHKLPEHTWGGCGCEHLNISTPETGWTRQGLAIARASGLDPFFRIQESTWVEQRNFIHGAVNALGLQSKLAATLRQQLLELRSPVQSVEELLRRGWQQIEKRHWEDPILLRKNVAVSVDQLTGAITSFKQGNVSLASKDHPLLRYAYRTHSADEIRAYKSTYGYAHDGVYPYHPPPHPLLPPGLPPGLSGTWYPSLTHVLVSPDGNSLALRLAFRETVRSRIAAYGAPAEVWLKMGVDRSNHVVAECSWDEKPPTRLPESSWLEVRPDLAQLGTSLKIYVDKLSGRVDVGDCVKNGGGALHGFSPAGGITFENSESHLRLLSVKSLDAGVVQPGFAGLSPINFTAFDEVPPKGIDGVAFNLHNNIYETNYVMYYPFEGTDKSSRFRFDLEY